MNEDINLSLSLPMLKHLRDILDSLISGELTRIQLTLAGTDGQPVDIIFEGEENNNGDE
jgi:hypothetical protein